MRIGLTASVIGHTALILASVLGFASARKLQAVPSTSVPVEVVSVGEAAESKLGLRKGERDKAPALDRQARQADAPREGPDKAKPSKTEAQAAPQPPAPKPAEPRHVEPKPAEAPPEPPRPKPAPAKPEKTENAEPVKKAENAEPLPPKRPEPKPAEQISPPKPKPPVAKAPEKPAPTRPVAQQEQKFDSEKIAALLNKAEPAPAARPQAPAAPAASLGTATGRSARLTASEIDALRSRLAECWNIPAGARDADKLVVRVRFNLNPDGSLNGAPALVEATPGPYSQVAVEAAMRAIRQCQPYAMLPAEKFETWRDITINFDPREMFGG
jgi:outer membrane biosynthesis protein TonB